MEDGRSVWYLVDLFSKLNAQKKHSNMEDCHGLRNSQPVGKLVHVFGYKSEVNPAVQYSIVHRSLKSDEIYKIKKDLCFSQ